MITWLNVLGAVLLIAVASVWMVRRRQDRTRRNRRDSHWGDWPPDQMAR